jgi:hypothetical protein
MPLPGVGGGDYVFSAYRLTALSGIMAEHRAAAAALQAMNEQVRWQSS